MVNSESALGQGVISRAEEHKMNVLSPKIFSKFIWILQLMPELLACPNNSKPIILRQFFDLLSIRIASQFHYVVREHVKYFGGIIFVFPDGGDDVLNEFVEFH